jgi:hypothetical protein
MERDGIAILIALLITLVISASTGCLEENVGDGKTDDGGENDSIEVTESGSSHLEEREEETVLVIDMEEGQLLSRLTFELRWTDEEPENRIRRYVNEGDEFLIKVSEGSNATVMESGRNMIGMEGRIMLEYPCDIADNQTRSNPCSFELTVFLVDAGEQHPWYTGEDRASIEDTGNDFTWTAQYSYLERK